MGTSPYYRGRGVLRGLSIGQRDRWIMLEMDPSRCFSGSVSCSQTRTAC